MDIKYWIVLRVIIIGWGFATAHFLYMNGIASSIFLYLGTICSIFYFYYQTKEEILICELYGIRNYTVNQIVEIINQPKTYILIILKRAGYNIRES